MSKGLTPARKERLIRLNVAISAAKERLSTQTAPQKCVVLTASLALRDAGIGYKFRVYVTDDVSYHECWPVHPDPYALSMLANAKFIPALAAIAVKDGHDPGKYRIVTSEVFAAGNLVANTDRLIQHINKLGIPAKHETEPLM